MCCYSAANILSQAKKKLLAINKKTNYHFTLGYNSGAYFHKLHSLHP